MILSHRLDRTGYRRTNYAKSMTFWGRNCGALASWTRTTIFFTCNQDLGEESNPTIASTSAILRSTRDYVTSADCCNPGIDFWSRTVPPAGYLRTTAPVLPATYSTISLSPFLTFVTFARRFASIATSSYQATPQYCTVGGEAEECDGGGGFQLFNLTL